MGPEISSSTQAPPSRLTSTNYSKTTTNDPGTTQIVRQAQAEQQRAAQNTAVAQASVQESQNNLRAAQAEERQINFPSVCITKDLMPHCAVPTL